MFIKYYLTLQHIYNEVVQNELCFTSGNKMNYGYKNNLGVLQYKCIAFPPSCYKSSERWLSTMVSGLTEHSPPPPPYGHPGEQRSRTYVHSLHTLARDFCPTGWNCISFPLASPQPSELQPCTAGTRGRAALPGNVGEEIQMPPLKEEQPGAFISSEIKMTETLLPSTHRNHVFHLNTSLFHTAHNLIFW